MKTKTKNSLTSLVHTFFCKMKHGDSMQLLLEPEDAVCNFYLEANMEECWELPAHQSWTVFTNVFVAICEEHKVDPITVMEKFMTIYRIREDFITNIPELVPYLNSILGIGDEDGRLRSGTESVDRHTEKDEPSEHGRSYDDEDEEISDPFSSIETPSWLR
jgi:hypothetical protein